MGLFEVRVWSASGRGEICFFFSVCLSSLAPTPIPDFESFYLYLSLCLNSLISPSFLFCASLSYLSAPYVKRKYEVSFSCVETSLPYPVLLDLLWIIIIIMSENYFLLSTQVFLFLLLLPSSYTRIQMMKLIFAPHPFLFFLFSLPALETIMK